MSKISQYDLDMWVDSTDGVFHVRDAMRELNLPKTDEQHLRVYLGRLVKRGVLESVGGKMGNYRLVQTQWAPIDVFGESKFHHLIFPVPIQKYVRLGRGGMFLVAGEKDAGKTGFLLNVAMRNAGRHKIRYFETGETGPDLMRERLLEMDPTLTSLPFELLQLDGAPEDTVKKYPDDITIIDYIEAPEDAWRIVGTLTRLSLGLAGGQGGAIIALQKPKGRDDAYGGGAVKNKGQIYVALESKNGSGFWKCRIVTAKSRVQTMIDPVGKEWKYHIKKLGTEFADMDPDDWVDEPPPIDDEPEPAEVEI